MIRFFRTGARLALPLVTLFVATAALAQDAASEPAIPDELRGIVGDWVLATDDENQPTCPVVLTDQPAPGGWAVVLPATCAAPYPPAATLSAWTLDDSDGSLLLLDGGGTVTMRLLDDEDGLYDTDPNVEPRFYLTAPYAGDSGGEDDAAD